MSTIEFQTDIHSVDQIQTAAQTRADQFRAFLDGKREVVHQTFVINYPSDSIETLAHEFFLASLLDTPGIRIPEYADPHDLEVLRGLGGRSVALFRDDTQNIFIARQAIFVDDAPPIPLEKGIPEPPDAQFVDYLAGNFTQYPKLAALL